MSELFAAKELSKVVFGRESSLLTRLTIMGFTIDPPEPFREKDISEKIPGVNVGLIGRELSTLVIVGAIKRMPELDMRSSIFYCRLESAMWSLVTEQALRTTEFSSLQAPQV